MGKNLLPVKGIWSDPGSGQVPHAAEQLSPCHNYWARTLQPVFTNERSHRNEKQVHHSLGGTRHS